MRGGGSGGMRLCALAAVLVCLTGIRAEARVETLRWTHPDPAEVSAFRIHWGTAAQQYARVIHAGLPSASAGVYSFSVEVPDSDRVYFAVTAFDSRTGLSSEFSNERVREATTPPDPDPGPPPPDPGPGDPPPPPPDPDPGPGDPPPDPDPGPGDPPSPPPDPGPGGEPPSPPPDPGPGDPTPPPVGPGDSPPEPSAPGFTTVEPPPPPGDDPEGPPLSPLGAPGRPKLVRD